MATEVAQEQQDHHTKREKLLADCRALLAAGKRVEAIKQYRVETGASLAMAREVFERSA
jgi:ribosomal protein L7/L12